MRYTRLFATFALLSALAALSPKGHAAAPATATIRGYVLDSACAFLKDLKKPVSRECAIACAKAGSPLVILSDDGTLYWPVSSAMPAKGQNGRLLEFAGKRVAVTGQIYPKGGSRAIVMDRIEAAEGSH